MSSTSYPPHDDYPGGSQQPEKASSGLRLVLPSLSALKAQKSKKKIKLTFGEPVKKQPRPIKLKPLKEVLTKLIVQIKKCVLSPNAPEKYTSLMSLAGKMTTLSSSNRWTSRRSLITPMSFQDPWILGR